MVKKYCKKPVVVEAVQWTGENIDEIVEFCGEYCNSFDWSDVLYIYTLGGHRIARVGDYIIKGVRGEFYPCMPHIFEETYDAVIEEEE